MGTVDVTEGQTPLGSQTTLRPLVRVMPQLLPSTQTAVPLGLHPIKGETAAAVQLTQVLQKPGSCTESQIFGSVSALAHTCSINVNVNVIR